MKKSHLSITIAAAAVFSAQACAGIEETLLRAACEFEGQYAGAIYQPSLISTEYDGSTVYAYNVEGCGGGNHVSSHVSFIKNGRVTHTGQVPSHVAAPRSDAVKRFKVVKAPVECGVDNPEMVDQLTVEMSKGGKAFVYPQSETEISFSFSPC